MVTLLTIQILSIVATALTNILGILTFATDYWSTVVYDFVKLRSFAKWLVLEEINNGEIHIINNTNETQILTNTNYTWTTVIIGIEKNLLLFSTHKGIFRQCNYLSDNIRSYFKIPKCRAIKNIVTRQNDDHVYGLVNLGREFIRKYSFSLILFVSLRIQ